MLLQIEVLNINFLQDLLIKAGAVLWLDPGIRLLTGKINSMSMLNINSASTDEKNTLMSDSSFKDISIKTNDLSGGDLTRSSLLTLWSTLSLRSNGVRTWPLIHPASHLPTAAHTHPDMFKAFHTHKHLYDFHQMSEGGVLLLFNTDQVHNELMKPWVTCALTQGCISPVGAQESGCRYDKKPLFRYTGCHLYDTSAFNIALGLMFGQDSTPHLSSTSPFTRTPAKVTEDTTEESHLRSTKVSFHELYNGSFSFPVRNKLTDPDDGFVADAVQNNEENMKEFSPTFLNNNRNNQVLNSSAKKIVNFTKSIKPTILKLDNHHSVDSIKKATSGTLLDKLLNQNMTNRVSS